MDAASFNKLADKWHRDSAYCKLISTTLNHKNVPVIVRHASSHLPEIKRHLQDTHWYGWFHILARVFGIEYRGDDRFTYWMSVIEQKLSNGNANKKHF